MRSSKSTTPTRERCVESSLGNVLSGIAAAALAIFTLASAAFVVALILHAVGASDFQQGVGGTAFAFWWPRLFSWLNKNAER